MRSYAELCNGDGPIVLGQRLLPLTLGHVIHLTNADSLFLRNFKLKLPETKEQLLGFTVRIMAELGKALAICSMTFEQYDAWQWDVKAQRKWYRQLSKDIEAFAAIGKLDLLDSVYILNEYVEAAHKSPRFLPTASKGSTSAPPSTQEWYVPLICSLCSAYHLSKLEVLNQPLQVSIIDFYTNAQANGEGRIVNDSEADLIEATRTKNVTPEMKQKLAESLAKHMKAQHGR